MAKKHSLNKDNQNQDILIIGALFVGLVLFFKWIGFWSMLGLSEPTGLMVQGLLFLSLMFAFYNLVFKHFVSIYFERQSQTKGRRQEANLKTDKALQMEKEYEQAIEKAKIDAFATKQAILLNAEQEERDRIVQARKKNEETVNQEKALLFERFKNVENDLQKDIPQLSKEILLNIMGAPRKNP